jgi:hypothetical protein
MNEQCVINVGTGRYVKGTDRLAQSLKPYGTHIISWKNNLPPNSPTHNEHPYAFKAYAFKFAREAGHRLVLWCDSAVIAIKNPQRVFDAIKRDGYFFHANGWSCGQWTTDESLKIMGLTRDQVMPMPDFTGCCMGIDMSNKIALEWFDKWFYHSTSGAFIGDWKNNKQQCSKDPRCLGHRHDQVIGSIIFNQLKMKFNDEGLFQYPPSDWSKEPLRESSIFINKGC